MASLFSVICVYNDEATLNNHLLESLERQSVKFDLITLDNRKNAYESAAQALNEGASRAKGDFLLFAHQDVFLLEKEWLEKAASYLEQVPDLGVAGIAGMRETELRGLFHVGTIPVKSGIGKVFHGLTKAPWNSNTKFFEPMEVQTLDEQILIIPKDIFEKYPFDEKICAGWHLYGVDYSLSVRKRSLKSYVFPLPVWHLSTGSIDKGYYGTLRMVLSKHKDVKHVFTTCGYWHADYVSNCLELFAMAMKGEIAKWLGRNSHGASPYLKIIKLMYLSR